MSVRRVVLSFAVVGAGTFGRPASAQADEVGPARTQLNVGLRAGVAGQGTGSVWPETLFLAGLHGDALFGRRSPRSFGYGPAVAVSTLGFRDLTGAVGASFLLPVHDYLPIVVSAGPTVRTHETFGTNAGGFASVFWGTRSFNYTGTWGLVGGVVLEGRQTFGSPRDHALIVSAHLDLQVLTLPVAALVNLFRLRRFGRLSSRPRACCRGRPKAEGDQGLQTSVPRHWRQSTAASWPKMH
jgi:hypothetical protein